MSLQTILSTSFSLQIYAPLCTFELVGSVGLEMPELPVLAGGLKKRLLQKRKFTDRLEIDCQSSSGGLLYKTKELCCCTKEYLIVQF